MEQIPTEILLKITIKLDILSLLRLCLCIKKINFIDEIWTDRLLEFPNYFYHDYKNRNTKEIYILLSRLSIIKKTLKISENIFEIYNISELLLNGKELTELPKSLRILDNLRKFYLGSNKMKVVPIEILYLNLKTLDLSNNKIVEIPVQLGNMINLKELNFNNNKIKIIPQEFKFLVNLKFLYLDYNVIKIIPKEIGHMSSLKVFSISSNLLQEIPIELAKLNLKEFRVFNNQIQKVPKIFSHLIT